MVYLVVLYWFLTQNIVWRRLNLDPVYVKSAGLKGSEKRILFIYCVYIIFIITLRSYLVGFE